jgi:pimeloyl-ACP methyl ester carboxylesterase
MATIAVSGARDGVNAALRAAGHDVVVVALDGADTFTDLADQVASAVNGQTVVAMGVSVGSAAALAFARHHSDRCAALVLVHPVFLYGPRPELADAADRAALSLVAALAKDSLLERPDDLAAISQPTLVVGRPGEALHPIEVAEAYWRTIPTSRLVVETPGDVPLLDRPDDLAATVDRFLAEVLPA